MNTKLYISILFLLSNFSAFSMEVNKPKSFPKSIELSPLELAIITHQIDLEVFEQAQQNLEDELRKSLEYRILNKNNIKTLSYCTDRAAAQERFSMIKLLAISPTHQKFHINHGLR